MPAETFIQHIHQLAEKVGKLQTVESLRQGIRVSGNDDANE
jgi:hypothetical protein